MRRQERGEGGKKQKEVEDLDIGGRRAVTESTAVSGIRLKKRSAERQKDRQRNRAMSRRENGHTMEDDERDK